MNPHEQFFGISIFPRLIQRRMEADQLPLESTESPPSECCSQIDYEAMVDFINEYRKLVGQTPYQW